MDLAALVKDVCCLQVVAKETRDARRTLLRVRVNLGLPTANPTVLYV
jgi:hypothetical protein